eukprot:scaffold429_cov269-Pinguiococcus_pyrenoidosus.AAC.2
MDHRDHRDHTGQSMPSHGAPRPSAYDAGSQRSVVAFIDRQLMMMELLKSASLAYCAVSSAPSKISGRTSS